MDSVSETGPSHAERSRSTLSGSRGWVARCALGVRSACGGTAPVLGRVRCLNPGMDSCRGAPRGQPVDGLCAATGCVGVPDARACFG
eukprot:scaffold3428_cov379-Prasinococcus_capsulatus_cf.AAC.26